MISKYSGDGNGNNAISGRGVNGLEDILTVLNKITTAVNLIYGQMENTLSGGFAVEGAGGLITLLGTSISGLLKVAVAAALSGASAGLLAAIDLGYLLAINQEQQLVDGLLADMTTSVSDQLNYDQNFDAHDETLYTVTESNIRYLPLSQGFSTATKIAIVGPFVALAWNSPLPGFQKFGESWAFTASS